MTDEEFNERIRTDDRLETTKETTDDEILERVMSEMLARNCRSALHGINMGFHSRVVNKVGSAIK